MYLSIQIKILLQILTWINVVQWWRGNKVAFDLFFKFAIIFSFFYCTLNYSDTFSYVGSSTKRTYCVRTVKVYLSIQIKILLQILRWTNVLQWWRGNKVAVDLIFKSATVFSFIYCTRRFSIFVTHSKIDRLFVHWW